MLAKIKTKNVVLVCNFIELLLTHIREAKKQKKNIVQWPAPNRHTSQMVVVAQFSQAIPVVSFL